MPWSSSYIADFPATLAAPDDDRIVDGRLTLTDADLAAPAHICPVCCLPLSACGEVTTCPGATP